MASQTEGPLEELLLGAAVVAWELVSSAAANLSLRRVRETKATPIRDAKLGEIVTVHGVIRRTLAPLTAPLSGQPCAAFVVRCVRRTMPQHDLVDFEIEDETGRAHVHAQGADILFASSSTVHRRFSPTDDVGEWLAKWPATFRRPVSIVERRLSVGDRVAVQGHAVWREEQAGTEDASYRSASHLLHLEPARRPVRIATC
jgi:hypothetical protein